MRNFNNKKRSGGGNGRSNKYEKQDRGRSEMHQTTCSDCGDKCEVPFKPSGDKPVRCNHCFRKNKGDDFRGKDNFRSKDKPWTKREAPPVKNYDKEFEFLKYEIEDLNEKLDKALKILNILRPEKKVFMVNKDELEEVQSNKEEAIEEEPKKKKKVAKKTTAKKATTKKKTTTKKAKK